MPATFAHCLIAQEAIDIFSKDGPKDHVEILGEGNNYVITGAAGPDYPYLTDILTTGVLQIGHTWANRMHYENAQGFVTKGVDLLSRTQDKGESFAIRLAWFYGYVSHLIADSYVHPVVNATVGGPYMFTHAEHGKCELIQDIYIFNKKKKQDIVESNPKSGPFGYLKILDLSSAPDDPDRIHPEIRTFWKGLLEAAHPKAREFFDGIDPDRWHYNYKGRVNFVVDPGAIFRHVLGMKELNYKKALEINQDEYRRYIDKIILPNGQEASYDTVFNKAVQMVVTTWKKLSEDIIQTKPGAVVQYIKDWNLDTGVDEKRIDLWI